jgi:hypothetical protein
MLQSVKKLDEVVVGCQWLPFQTMWCLSGAMIVSESDNCPWWTGEIEEDEWCCGLMEEGCGVWARGIGCRCPVVSPVLPCGLHHRTWQPALETLMEGPRRLLEWNETWEFRGVRKGGGWHFRARDFGIYNMLRP